MKRNETKKKQGHVSAPGENLKDEEQVEASGELTTGISWLDELLDNSLNETLAAIHVCLKLSWKNNTLGDKIQDILRLKLKEFRKGEFPSDLDLECDVLPALKWLIFLNGFEAGSMTETEHKEHLDSYKSPKQDEAVAEARQKVTSSAIDKIMEKASKSATGHVAHPNKPDVPTIQKICDFFQSTTPREKLLLWMIWELGSVTGYTSLDIANELMATIDNTLDVGNNPELNELKGICEGFELLNTHS